ncbi:glycosyltransferase family 4 protein [Pseudarthrobacter sp. NamE2]|uniref:glycosyltransferase family 4 protein n=1 Tax=Pseudarthrobacter sp. NamE2 TaxID=2576838 RepID=UPI0014852CFA|nr:glycosyltransferase family 4 protein [Pseudarthrobacter sp. NamE2]
MKVALVHSYYSSRQPSGENVVVDAQAAALRAHGVDVRVVAARTDDLEKRTGYKLASAVNVSLGRGLSPIEELQRFGPDVVHVHNLFPNWGTSWLTDWRGPMVTTVHNFRPVCAAGTLFLDGKVCTRCPDSSSLKAVTNACYRESKIASVPLAIRNRKGVAGDRLLSRADRVILLSPRAQHMYHSFGLPPDKTEIIPNFVSDSGFQPWMQPGVDWVYVGRLTAEKGITKLLRHWPDNVNLRVYGDGPLRQEVEALSRSNVRYLGQISHNEVPRVLAESRGLVFPSEWAEGLPMIYAEALASGRLVVAKSGNSAADDISLHNVGQVFHSWNDIGAALEHVCNREAEIGLRARAHFESSYSRHIWLAKTMDLYRSVSSMRI